MPTSYNISESNIMTCNACNTTIYDRLMSKTSPDNKIWHSTCLKCCECNQLLDSKYFELNGRLYCRNDYLTFFRPSCTGCGNKIYDEQYFFSIASNSPTIKNTNTNNNNNQQQNIERGPEQSGIKNNNVGQQADQQLHQQQSQQLQQRDNSDPNLNSNTNSNNGQNITNNNNNNNNEDRSDNNNKTDQNSQLKQNLLTNLFFHDKCFICNYCAKPLSKGDRYCILENTPTSPNQTLMICHDDCAIKIHSAHSSSVQINEEQPIRQTTTKSGAPRARRGRTKQQTSTTTTTTTTT